MQPTINRSGRSYEVTALGSYADGHADDARVQTMFGISGAAADAIAVGTQLTWLLVKEQLTIAFN
ncbi:MAG: hypothetical protein CM15mP54_09610 [Paracoccaceae bacterium]|nr:MAG: hypothetical protein CM15mP54_09610 [Paracoccaceae bacterium]